MFKIKTETSLAKNVLSTGGFSNTFEKKFKETTKASIIANSVILVAYGNTDYRVDSLKSA